MNATYYLHIARANAHGHDKMDFEDRIAWSMANPEIAPSQAKDPTYALAIEDAMAGNPDVVVYLDATASGTQIMAALSNCLRSAVRCNLIGKHFRDAYTIAWKGMGSLPGVTRKMAKQAFMTAQFGSRAVPRDNLGQENLPKFYEMYARLFPGVWSAMNYFPTLWNPSAVNHKWTMPDGFEVVCWNYGMAEETVTFMGQTHVVEKQVPVTKRRSNSLSANIVHSTDALVCREMVKRAQYDPVRAKYLLEHGFPDADTGCEDLVELFKSTGFATVALVGQLNQAQFKALSHELRSKVLVLLGQLAGKERAFPLLPIHDSFGARARDCSEVVRMYRFLMQQLWDSTLVEHIAHQLTGKRPRFQKTPVCLNGKHLLG